MNKHAGWMLIGSASLLFLSGGRPSQSLQQNTKQASNKTASEAQNLAQLAGYKHWTRANKKPALELSQTALLCRSVTAAELEQEKTNPHNDKYIVVYVNDIGKHALLRETKPTYPVGTLIVKEKRTKPNSATPELCTVMLKREAGYNPKGGNWQYFVTDGTATRFQNNGDSADCKSCHEKQKPVDYVFRRYLPDIAYRYLEHPAQKPTPSKL